MIITRLRGGLGNQLFQYACGRAISLRTKNLMKLDVTGYIRASAQSTETRRNYSLSYFAIDEHVATDDEIRQLKYPFGIVSKGWRFFKIKILRQFNVGFNAHQMQRLTRTKNLYLDGFWQSEKFFEDHADTIRKEIRLKKPMCPAAADVAGLIEKNKNTGIKNISIHVRRGDVQIGGDGNDYYGICTPAYYAKAFACAAATNAHVFVFSDEPEWVRANITIPYPATFVSGKNISDCEELILMSMCSTNIIANSTFSWWGAWLNANHDKIVIAPKEWAVRGKKQHIDTVPPTWIRL